MKFLKMFLQFFKKNVFLSIFVLLEMALSMFLFTDQLGTIQYNNYALDLYKSSGLDNFDHFSADMIPGEIDNEKSGSDIIYDAVMKTKGVSNAATLENILLYDYYDFEMKIYNNQFYMIIFNNKTFENVRLHLSSGTWCNEDANDGVINAVAVGSVATRYNVGDIINNVVDDLNDGVHLSAGTLKVRIVGKVAYPGYSIALGSSSTKMEASFLLGQTNGFIMLDTPANAALIEPYLRLANKNRCYLIKYDDNADQTVIRNARVSLGKWGTVTTPEEMVVNSENSIRKIFNKRLPMIMFFLIIASFSMISSVAVTQSKMAYDHTVYYLCGCPASRCYLYSGAAVFSLGTLALIINVIRIEITRGQMLERAMNKLLNGTTVLILAAYTVVTIALALLISYAVFKRNSPAENYRANS